MARPGWIELIIVAALVAVVLILVWNFKFRRPK
jgi:hypothetical protein